MEILKKAAGFFLILIAVSILIAMAATLPNSIEQCTAKFQESGNIGIAYLFGSLIGNAIFILILLFLVKKGLKLIRKTSKSNNPVDLD
jgi:Ca2+/Na+ antiporter